MLGGWARLSEVEGKEKEDEKDEVEEEEGKKHPRIWFLFS